MASTQKTVLVYIGSKEAFKSPINPHIEGRGQGGDLITCDALYVCGVFEISNLHLILYIAREGGSGA